MILELFKPNQYVKSFKDVDLIDLKEKGIKVFILDIDNTLVASKKDSLDEDAIRFVKQIKSCKIIPVIISNNVKKRVSVFASELDIDYYCFALKPSLKSYKDILKKYNVRASEVAVLGDQLLTDVAGGNRMNMLTILVDPISTKDNFFGIINRQVENLIFNYLESKDLIKKGKYYDM